MKMIFRKVIRWIKCILSPKYKKKYLARKKYEEKINRECWLKLKDNVSDTLIKTIEPRNLQRMMKK
jgi:hypothetical protein